MTKQKNIVGEIPRPKFNSKNIKLGRLDPLKGKIKCGGAKHINLNIGMCEKPKEIKDKKAEYVKLIFGQFEKPDKKGVTTKEYADMFDEIWGSKPDRAAEKEMNFLQAFIILLLAIFAFFLLQRAMDINALQNCEEKRDCAEVIRDINAN